MSLVKGTWSPSKFVLVPPTKFVVEFGGIGHDSVLLPAPPIGGCGAGRVSVMSPGLSKSLSGLATGRLHESVRGCFDCFIVSCKGIPLPDKFAVHVWVLLVLPLAAPEEYTEGNEKDQDGDTTNGTSDNGARVIPASRRHLVAISRLGGSILLARSPASSAAS